MVGPVPANPFSREVLIKSPTHYYGLRLDYLPSFEISERFSPQAVPEITEKIAVALADPSIRGFVNWMRFPLFEIEPSSDGYWLKIRDLRYVAPQALESPGIGMTKVFVPLEK